MKKKILIIFGDPYSINSEIIFKVWKQISNQLKKNIIIIGNTSLIQKQFKKLGYNIGIHQIKDLNENLSSNKLKVINIDLNFDNPFKVREQRLKKYIKQSFNVAHKILSNNKNVGGLINCPISKNLLGNKGLGVTEYLASKCRVKKNSEVMLIRNKNLAVSPLTTHIFLREVTKKLNKEIIIVKVKTIYHQFKKIFSRNPKIAILGLNPHNAEFKKNSEEVKIIIPAINYLKRAKINTYGPFSPDTIFIKDFKKFDIILGMYHDQVLTPFKTLYKFDAINLTLGLNYLRVSPDHGVAKNLIGQNKANPISLIECIKFLNKFG